MNKVFIIAMALAPFIVFAQTKEEAQHILDSKKVHYLNVDGDFDQKYPYMFLDKDNKPMGNTHLDTTVQSRPHCIINAPREFKTFSEKDHYWMLLRRLSSFSNIESFKYRREGTKVKFFFEQSDPWFKENPIIECGNVADKNPRELLKKLYSTTIKFESLIDGEKKEVKALHPHDTSLCIVDGEEYVKLNKLIKEVSSFGSLEIGDSVFIDSKVGTLVSINDDKAMVRFENNPYPKKFNLSKILKVEPVREYEYQSYVRVLDKKPRIGMILGKIVEDGETKVLLKNFNDIRKVSPHLIMKAN